MSAEAITLTVYFECPFWVGVCERWDGSCVQAARITFGAEPKDAEVWEFVCRNWLTLRFTAGVQSRPRGASRNPKRRQREAARATASRGPSTKSQLALARVREQEKLERRTAQKEWREEVEAERFALKQKKRKEKHRGH